MAEIVHSTSTPLACGVGIDGCDCDAVGPEEARALGYPPGRYVMPFCECHDCYVCGEIDCDGHISSSK